MRFTNRFSLFNDVQSRFAGFEAAQHILRFSGDFDITPRFTFSPLGYAYIWNYQYGKQPVLVANNEHRIYQQLSYRHKLSSSIVQHRVRTEERFIQVHSTNTSGEVIDEGYTNKQFRIRYRLSFHVPLTAQNDGKAMSIDPGSWYLFLFEELFISWGERVTYNEIDQNRVFIGLSYQFTKDFTIQAGPFWQLLVKANGAQQENNIGVGVWVFYNFDFRK